jgi:hypothetical protein
MEGGWDEEVEDGRIGRSRSSRVNVGGRMRR